MNTPEPTRHRMREVCQDDEGPVTGPAVYPPHARVPILVVEDNLDDAKLVAMRLGILRSVTRDVVHAATLGEATAWLSKHRCEAIILDLNLPDSKGFDALVELRRLRPSVPTVVVSGFVDHALHSAAMELGAEEVISKDELDSPLLPVCILSIIERNRAIEHERRLARILGAMPDAVVVTSSTGAIEYVNDSALTFFGKSRDEMTRASLFFAAPADTCAELCVTRSNATRFGILRVTELRSHGEVSFLSSIRDITEQRKLETQILLSDRLASLGIIAASVAHEINNPLGAVLANIELAMKDSNGDFQEELTDAHSATLRISQIVRDLKLFSRADESSCTTLDVHPVLDSVARMAANEIRHRATLIMDYRAERAIRGNESRLSQVFLNLMVNAAQSIPEGNAEGNEIRIVTRVGDGDRLLIEFKDTGSGIPPDVQRRLFGLFFTTKAAGAGSGLGLAISQRIVASLGGELSFVSEVGKGTCFTVSFPSVAAVTTPRSTRAPPSIPLAERRGRVLVVDDDVLVLNSVRWSLEGEHEVVCFDSGAGALAAVVGGEPFDVVLCDLLMPRTTGMDLHRAIERAEPSLARKMVFMTGGAFTRRARDFLTTKPNRRLEKPFGVEELRGLVNELVLQSHGEEPAQDRRHRPSGYAPKGSADQRRDTEPPESRVSGTANASKTRDAGGRRH